MFFCSVHCENGKRRDAHSWALPAVGGLGPCLSTGLRASQPLSCVVMLVYEHPVLFVLLTGGPSNGPDNPTMTPLFHPVLKHGAKPPVADKGHECPSSFSTFHSVAKPPLSFQYSTHRTSTNTYRAGETLQIANVLRRFPTQNRPQPAAKRNFPCFTIFRPSRFSKIDAWEAFFILFL
jgi:hypothetical protein